MPTMSMSAFRGKRTSLVRSLMSANDPLRTLGTVGRFGGSNELLLLPIRGGKAFLVGMPLSREKPRPLTN